MDRIYVLKIVKHKKKLQKYLGIKGKVAIQLREVMIEITCDGVIDESEKPQWNQIVKELDNVVETSMALKFVK